VTGLLNFAPLMQGQVDATAATDTGLAVGLRKGIGEVDVMPVRAHLNMSSDLFVVREETLREKKALLRAFLQGYRDSAAWMMAHPEEAAVLAGKRAIDGTQRDINLDVIRLRNAASLPEGKDAASRLGSFDLTALQKGADAYQALGLVQRRIKVSDVVDASLLTGA
jgi:NitT/TauT family transport system substrate-binding protein